MKVVFLLLALQQIALSTSQLKLTPAEYKAFLKALDGRRPVYLQSAIPISDYSNIKSDGKYLYWDINGEHKSGKLEAAKTIYARRRVHDDSYGGPKIVNFKEQLASPSGAYAQEFPPIYRNDVENLMAVTKRPQQLIRRLKYRERRDAKEDDASNKDKRQTDDDTDEDYEDEEPQSYREELSFGLSSAGGIFGGAVGGFLDTTGQAKLKLIRSLESLGLIGVTQFDAILDRMEKEKEERRLRQRKNRYGPPKPVYGAPVVAYVAPKPAYAAPQPTYAAPKDPSPTYGAPNVQENIIYSEPKLSFNVPQVASVDFDTDSGETSVSLAV